MGSWVRGGAPSTSTGAGWGAEGGASPQTTWEWSRSRKEAPSGHALGVKGAHYLSFCRRCASAASPAAAAAGLARSGLHPALALLSLLPLWLGRAHAEALPLDGRTWPG